MKPFVGVTVHILKRSTKKTKQYKTNQCQTTSKQTKQMQSKPYHVLASPLTSYAMHCNAKRTVTCTSFPLPQARQCNAMQCKANRNMCQLSPPTSKAKPCEEKLCKQRNAKQNKAIQSNTTCASYPRGFPEQSNTMQCKANRNMCQLSPLISKTMHCYAKQTVTCASFPLPKATQSFLQQSKAKQMQSQAKQSHAKKSNASKTMLSNTIQRNTNPYKAKRRFTEQMPRNAVNTAQLN